MEIRLPIAENSDLQGLVLAPQLAFVTPGGHQVGASFSNGRSNTTGHSSGVAAIHKARVPGQLQGGITADSLSVVFL